MVYAALRPDGTSSRGRTEAAVPILSPLMEDYVPRAPWRRRRTTDSPRPAGRRWAGRLRRSGSLARQVLLVGRRGRRRSEAGAVGATELVPDRSGVASPFGAQMDSLADMCSFGIAAPVVVYAWLAGSAPTILVVSACALVAVCAAVRLARFNVSPKDGRFFCGVPTTMVAAVLALGTMISPAMPPGVQVAAVA